MKLSSTGCAAAAALVAAAVSPALAQSVPSELQAQAAPPAEAAPPAAAAPAPAAPSGPTPLTWNGITFNAQIEGGISLDPIQEKGNENFGQLFTDHNNQFQLNQILLTAKKAIDTSKDEFQVGFTLQGLYGSDARYTQYLGEFDRSINSRYQFTLVEAAVLAHVPIAGTGGLDLTVGQFPTPEGYEVIDPSGNPFYSHSYIFNFGVPFTQTGGYGVLHVNPLLDLYAGIDTGVNSTFVRGQGDANAAPSYMAGFNLTLLGGKLTALVLSHFGPEDSALVVPHAGDQFRFLNDAVITYKYSDKTTFVTELNWIHENYFRANGIGVAQYVSYALNDNVTLNGRAEVYRDDKGFFVSEFPGDQSYVRSELGLPATVLGVPEGTYSEFTAGLTWKVPNLPAPIAGLIIRPEARLDYELSDRYPVYQGFRNRENLTFASDFILQF